MTDDVTDARGIDRENLNECWCCGGLHDSFGSLCPNCKEAGCDRFSDECKSDHIPVVPDGGKTGPSLVSDGGQSTPEQGDTMSIVEAPFWCPWCEEWIEDEDGYNHAYEHQDKAPYAVYVEEMIHDAQEDAP